MNAEKEDPVKVVSGATGGIVPTSYWMRKGARMRRDRDLRRKVERMIVALGFRQNTINVPLSR